MYCQQATAPLLCSKCVALNSAELDKNKLAKARSSARRKLRRLQAAQKTDWRIHLSAGERAGGPWSALHLCRALRERAHALWKSSVTKVQGIV